MTTSGSPNVSRAGAATLAAAAERDSAVYPGDIVQTGPSDRISLLFTIDGSADGSVLILDNNTEVELTNDVIEHDNRKYHRLCRLVHGQVYARDRPSVALETRFGMVYVRGTDIDITSDQDLVGVTVIEGAVEFSNSYGAVVVHESQQSTARDGQAPTPPVTLQSPGLTIEWTVSMDRAFLPRELFYSTLSQASVAKLVQDTFSAVQANPDDPGAHVRYGDALFDGGKIADAADQYRAAIGLAPSDPSPRVRLADALLELDQLDGAEAAYADALKLDPKSASAEIGSTWLDLRRDQPEEAVRHAGLAVAEAPDSSLAEIALGVALARLPGQNDAARSALASALTGTPAVYRYQAHAWLSQLDLVNDNLTQALSEARSATQMEQDSALSHSALSLVDFFRRAPKEAVLEAQEAAKLNPRMVLAQVALGQAYLEREDPDQAARTAARAVALDPDASLSLYLLGVADAQRGDDVHAVRELRRCLSDTPNFVTADTALARVLIHMGRAKDAVAMLEPLHKDLPDNDGILAALGDAYHALGQYRQAAKAYRDALNIAPDSALYYSELAELSIDTNRLNDAVWAGQHAIALAPNIGQYHAVLGLAYQYSRLNDQAASEYTKALEWDPQNALAHAQSGLLNDANPFTSIDTFNQSFLYDPDVSRYMIAGGFDAESIANSGNDDQIDGETLVRNSGDSGRLNYLGSVIGNHEDDPSGRSSIANDTFDYSQNVTYEPDPNTVVENTAGYAYNRNGLPGLASLPAFPNDNDAIRVAQVGVAERTREASYNYIWAGLSGLDLWDAVNGEARGDERFDRQSLVPEFRWDTLVSRDPSRAAMLTLGGAEAGSNSPANLNLPFLQVNSPEWSVFRVAYGQWTQHISDKLSGIVQFRLQQTSTDVGFDTAGSGSTSESISHSHWLPSFSLSYQAEKRTLVQLSASEQQPTLTDLILAPDEPQLLIDRTTEQGLDFLIPYLVDDVRTAELNIARELPSSGEIRLEMFGTRETNVEVSTDVPSFAFDVGLTPPVILPAIQRTGATARCFEPVGRDVFVEAGIVVDRTVLYDPGSPANDEIAPYFPQTTSNVGLNYVDPHGATAQIELNHYGGFYQDSPLVSQPDRPTFSSRNALTVQLSKLISDHDEVFVNGTNLFNSSFIEFNDFPTMQRQVQVGFALFY